MQHCLAPELLRAPQFSPYLPLLRQLHWVPLTYRINIKLSTITYRALSTQQRSYRASLLHLSNVPRQLISSISQQLIVPKTKFNLDKRAFSVSPPRVWNELPITLKPSSQKNTTYVYSKLNFHHEYSVVPRSDLCASLFTIMLNDSVLLRL